MKNLLLILALTGAFSFTVFGEEDLKDKDGKMEKREVTAEKAEDKHLSRSFTAAFGMSERDNKEVSTGMAAVSTSAVNHVTTPFTPHMPK